MNFKLHAGHFVFGSEPFLFLRLIFVTNLLFLDSNESTHTYTRTSADTSIEMMFPVVTGFLLYIQRDSTGIFGAGLIYVQIV